MTNLENRYPARDLTRLDWHLIRTSLQEAEERHRDDDRLNQVIRDTWGRVNSVIDRLGPVKTKQLYVSRLPMGDGQSDLIIWGYQDGTIHSIESRTTFDPELSLEDQVMPYYKDWLVTRVEAQLDGYVTIFDLEERTAP